MILYDLAGENEDFRFSPYCWRARFALAHKGFQPELRPWRFTEKDRIAASGQPLVPVLLDGAHTIHDSWSIACYLEDSYPERPKLFGGPEARAMAQFIALWGETVVHPILVKSIILRIQAAVHPKDREYFRQSREKRFAMSLEEYARPVREGLAELRNAMQPMRVMLTRGHDYLAGRQPGYADYAVLGNLQFGRSFIAEPIFSREDPLAGWLERMFDTSGFGRDIIQFEDRV